jgi:type IV pilus assembly protein PilA
MRAQTQLALLQQMHQRHNLVRKGFTLVELMIVVAIIGLLSAVALPQFLAARDRADAKAKVGEAVGLAKECAVFNAESDRTATSVRTPQGSFVVCGGNTSTEHVMSSRAFNVQMAVDCAGATLAATTPGVKITISPSGQMTCESNT